MSRTRLVFDCPRHLAAGLRLIAIADGTDRAAVLQRAVIMRLNVPVFVHHSTNSFSATGADSLSGYGAASSSGYLNLKNIWWDRLRRSYPTSLSIPRPAWTCAPRRTRAVARSRQLRRWQAAGAELNRRMDIENG